MCRTRLRRTLFFVFVLILCGSVFTSLPVRKKQSVESSTEVFSKKSTNIPFPELAFPQLSFFPQMPLLPNEQCTADWESILNTNAVRIDTKFAERLYEKVRNCPIESLFISRAMQKIYSSCTSVGREESYNQALEINRREKNAIDIDSLRLSDGEVQKYCQLSLVELQRSLIASRVDESNLQNESDVFALKNLLLVTRAWENVSQWRATVERILSLDPSNAVASQLYLSAVMNDIMEGRRNNDSQSWNRNERDMEWGISFLQKDHPRKAEWEFIRLSQSLNEERMEDAALQIIQDYPSSGVGWYVLSLVNRQRGDWNKAILNVVQALKADPDNQEYKAALIALRSHKEPSMSIGHFPDPELVLVQ